MKKSTLILITLCLVFSVNIFVFAEEKAPSPNISPTGSAGLNVVMIVLDACRADHLGCYGYSRPTSPNIDKFAAESIIFEQAYSQGVQTFVSFSSFLTGKYPASLNAYWDGRNNSPMFLPLQQEELTLAEILRTHNYSTVAFPTGLHLSPGFGLSQGFQIYTNNPEFLAEAKSRTNGGDFSRKEGVDYEFVRAIQRDGQPITSPVWSFQDTLPLALKYLESFKTEPFFMLLHTNDTHPPYDNPLEFAHKFDPDYQGPVCQDSRLSINLHDIRNNKLSIDDMKEITLSDQDLKHIIAHYDGGVAYADDCVGRILKQLTDSGLDQNTIVVIMSDHGDGLGERGFFGRGAGKDTHLRLSNELCRVPLIIKLPPSLKSAIHNPPPQRGEAHSAPVGARPTKMGGASRIHTPVQLVDLMPTILDFLDIKPPADIGGISLKELMLNNAPLPKERPIVTEGMPNRLAFRINNWKLIQKEGDSALYNLKDDPGEKNNLTDNPATKEIQESLLKKLRDWQKEHIAKRGSWINDKK